MRKILLCLLLILLMMPLSAHDIWDAFNDKITIAEYIDEYKELKQVQEMKEILAQIIAEPKKNNEELISRLTELLFVNGIAVAKTIKNINTDPKVMKLIKKKVEYLVVKYEKPLEHLKQLIKEHKACLKRAKRGIFDILYAIERCEPNIDEAYKIIKKLLEPEMAYEFIRKSLERKLKSTEKAEKMAKQILEAA